MNEEEGGRKKKNKMKMKKNPENQAYLPPTSSKQQGPHNAPDLAHFEMAFRSSISSDEKRERPARYWPDDS